MNTKAIRIVAFGDSITLAVNGMPDPAKRWPAIVEARLKNQYPDVVMINAGAGGNTSREGLARMEKDVLARRPHFVLVEFGGNDTTLTPERRVPLDEFWANLAVMKEKLDAMGARMILLPFPPVIDSRHGDAVHRAAFKDDGGQDAFIERYRQATREFAARHGLVLIAIDQALRRDLSGNVLSDGVHLTEAGNRAVADAVTPVLASCLDA